MREWFREAWSGWQEWIRDGKVMALFFAALLFLWFGRREYRSGKAGVLLRYASAAALLCVLPPSAALLMRYQTRFYPYKWVWTLVPVTIVTACAATLLVEEHVLSKLSGTWKSRLQGLGFALLSGGILALCGTLGETVEGVRVSAEESGYVAGVLETVWESHREQMDAADGGSICLWAPREILEYARALDGDITLLYGRNLWDRYLDAYTYDTYDENDLRLFVWMERAAGRDVSGYGLDAELLEQLAAEETDAGEMVALAAGKGANCILLPGTLPREELAALEAGAYAVETAGDYYLLLLDQEAPD